jgi:hypothetical protein
MITASTDVTSAVAGYARRLHQAVGECHHVASPLGAWLLLALCGPASSGAARAGLAEVLGLDVEQAAAAAGRLLSAPHPLVAAAAGVWRRDGVQAEALSRWLASLPATVDTGALTDQAALDDWARRTTLGLIDRFPVELTDETLLMLGTALATKISWAQPFDVAPASALGPHSPWAGTLRRVLRTPQLDWGHGHSQFIAAADQVGDVAVHTARARDGLQVTSVAARPGVPAADVLTAACQLASAIATGRPVARRSLFTLPLGAAPLWEVTEQQVQTSAPDGRAEYCTAVLPAWSADSTHDLSRHPGLGFGAAAAALAALAGLDEFAYEARQAAVARYSRTGFEAAAVTGLVAPGGMPRTRPGVMRTAVLRFGQPYAVVAVTADPDQRAGPPVSSPWRGLPVFSAWITQPEDADDPATDRIRRISRVARGARNSLASRTDRPVPRA